MKRRDFLKLLVSLPLLTEIKEERFNFLDVSLDKIYVAILNQRNKEVYVISYRTLEEKKVIDPYIYQLSKHEYFTLYEIHDNAKWLKYLLTGIMGSGAAYLYHDPSSQKENTIIDDSRKDFVFSFSVGGLLGYIIGEKIEDKVYNVIINNFIEKSLTSYVIIYGPQNILKKEIDKKLLHKVISLKDLYSKFIEKMSFI